jgi:hypothetical protein
MHESCQGKSRGNIKVKCPYGHHYTISAKHCSLCTVAAKNCIEDLKQESGK